MLTVKREAKIVAALDEIERQKSLLNVWLGQNNLRNQTISAILLNE
jgi:hypothetical protein